MIFFKSDYKNHCIWGLESAIMKTDRIQTYFTINQSSLFPVVFQRCCLRVSVFLAKSLLWCFSLAGLRGFFYIKSFVFLWVLKLKSCFVKSLQYSKYNKTCFKLSGLEGKSVQPLSSDVLLKRKPAVLIYNSSRVLDESPSFSELEDWRSTESVHVESILSLCVWGAFD